MKTLLDVGRGLLILGLLLMLLACEDDGRSDSSDGDEDRVSDQEMSPLDSEDTEFNENTEESDSSLCVPGRWYCKDTMTVWRCNAQGTGYTDENSCWDEERCINGGCRIPDSDGDLDGGESEADGDDDGTEQEDGDTSEAEESPGELEAEEIEPGDDDAPGELEHDPDLELHPELDPDPEPEKEKEPDPDIDPDSPFQSCEGRSNTALITCPRNLIDDQDALGYDNAREVMFSELDNVNGRVQCVYTGEWVTTDDIPPSTVMNCEHSWPQSLGAENEPARSDLHHLFPTISSVNSRRSNHWFGIVVDESWSGGGSKFGTDAYGNTVFEPRLEHKGDVARALFYFSVRYDLYINNTMEPILKQWNHLDPVSEKERRRNDGIEGYQHNRNPFIDNPGFADSIYDF